MPPTVVNDQVAEYCPTVNSNVLDLPYDVAEVACKVIVSPLTILTGAVVYAPPFFEILNPADGVAVTGTLIPVIVTVFDVLSVVNDKSV